MGITEIFSDGANLRDLLDSDEQLKISDVIHKAFIEVTEKGTEAGKAFTKIFSIHQTLVKKIAFVFLQVHRRLTCLWHIRCRPNL